MQYQVPQFIDVEDKIFGPLTLKQFVYVGGGVGLGFVLYKFLPSFIAYPLIGAEGGLAIALAFVEVNKKPFINVLESAFMYIIHARLYLWKADYKREKVEEEELKLNTGINVPNLTENKLKSLSWSLDINEQIDSDRKRKSLELIDPNISHADIARRNKLSTLLS